MSLNLLLFLFYFFGLQSLADFTDNVTAFNAVDDEYYDDGGVIFGAAVVLVVIMVVVADTIVGILNE